MTNRVPKEAFSFFKKLEKNNNRDWFNEHKPEFKAMEKDVKAVYNSIFENLNVHDEIDKCIIHMDTGLFSANRSESLHAKIIQLLPKRISRTDTNSLAFTMRMSGLGVIINPDYFLKTLKTTKERTSALRHIEQHAYLMHPKRERSFRVQCMERGEDFHPELFWIAAELEANEFISGYEDVPHAITKDSLGDIKTLKAASAETLYHHFLPKWKEDSSFFTELKTEKCPCDQQHWQGERTYDKSGSEVSSENIDPFTWELLHNEMDRILIVARETLDIGKIKQLPKEEQGKLDEVLKKHNLVHTDPKIAQQCEAEIDAILVKMFRRSFNGIAANSLITLEHTG